MSSGWVNVDSIRDRFSKAMSAMYQAEVPQYGTLLKIVREVNNEVLSQDIGTFIKQEHEQQVNRLSVERHGAIRLGTAAELATMRELFGVMGMHPVGYYDLSAAGVPVHATAFRPVTETALQINPFRVFTSLLRLELIDNEALRQQVNAILAARDIFTPRVRELIVINERQGGLNDHQADEFVSEALETFRWHHQALVSLETYNALLEQHRLIADVVCFRGPHINHLTPRTLDIDEVQKRMPLNGITPKETIEGPPRRQNPILLRQTSFKALNEAIHFTDHAAGTHTARFGEIEQRGLALTRKGRALYDRLLIEASATEKAANLNHQQHLAQIFAAFPDDLHTLRQQKLGYFRYRRSAQDSSIQITRDNLEQSIANGLVTVEPIVYEDFLPVSAAGIFQSNLGGDTSSVNSGNPNQQDFEKALGHAVIDEFGLYEELEALSLARVFAAL